MHPVPASAPDTVIRDNTVFTTPNIMVVFENKWEVRAEIG